MDGRIFSAVISIYLLMMATIANAGDPFAGSPIYTEYCVGCHGADGRGELAGTPSFRGGRIMMKGDIELINTINNGRAIMPSFRGVLTDSQIQDVVAYLRTFL
ncbi:MAG: cytochrome c [Gammaproteobacteria bacterium]|nr:cytochrome c [Gammaproteobacteria bacterium]